jgi:hypothetical protein
MPQSFWPCRIWGVLALRVAVHPAAVLAKQKRSTPHSRLETRPRRRFRSKRELVHELVRDCSQSHPAAVADKAETRDEHSEQARTPNTNEPRDGSRCGALSLLEKPLHYMGGHKKWFSTLL